MLAHDCKIAIFTNFGSTILALHQHRVTWPRKARYFPVSSTHSLVVPCDVTAKLGLCPSSHTDVIPHCPAIRHCRMLSHLSSSLACNCSFRTYSQQLESNRCESTPRSGHSFSTMPLAIFVPIYGFHGSPARSAVHAFIYWAIRQSRDLHHSNLIHHPPLFHRLAAHKVLPAVLAWILTCRFIVSQDLQRARVLFYNDKS